MTKTVTGGCECGKVTYSVNEPREAITVCHCSQCRRVSGHLWAATRALYENVTFLNDEGLEWYASSESAKRGFCRYCGSSLFYRLNDEDGIGIAAGSINSPTGFHLKKHIFVASKGDYYEISKDETQIQEY